MAASSSGGDPKTATGPEAGEGDSVPARLLSLRETPPLASDCLWGDDLPVTARVRRAESHAAATVGEHPINHLEEQA